MDLRNQDELLRKQEQLETYLLEHPQSELYAWYARQNMEAGELDRALKICRLGMRSVPDKGIIHKLMGEIYLAKGEVSRSMQHFVECVLTNEPFPGVIVELIKNLGDTMETDHMAVLINRLNKDLPGHPEVARFYKLHPEVRGVKAQAGQYDFLQELAAKLQQAIMVEVVEEEEETQEPETPAPAAEIEPEPPIEAVKPQVAPTPEPEPIPTPVKRSIPGTPRTVNVPKRKPVHRQDLAVKHHITRSMATFTLMQIFKSQGMYENALEVLQLLREKSSDLARIKKEEQEIRTLLAGNNKS